MRDIRRPTFVLPALMALLFVATSCGDPATMASGEVVDTSGKPIEGVVVVLESEIAGGYRKESEQKTGGDGKFNFVTITGAAKVVRLRFTKEGYFEKTQKIPALEESSNHIELQEK